MEIKATGLGRALVPVQPDSPVEAASTPQALDKTEESPVSASLESDFEAAPPVSTLETLCHAYEMGQGHERELEGAQKPSRLQRANEVLAKRKDGLESLAVVGGTTGGAATLAVSVAALTDGAYPVATAVAAIGTAVIGGGISSWKGIRTAAKRQLSKHDTAVSRIVSAAEMGAFLNDFKTGDDTVKAELIRRARSWIAQTPPIQFRQDARAALDKVVAEAKKVPPDAHEAARRMATLLDMDFGRTPKGPAHDVALEAFCNAFTGLGVEDQKRLRPLLFEAALGGKKRRKSKLPDATQLRLNELLADPAQAAKDYVLTTLAQVNKDGWTQERTERFLSAVNALKDSEAKQVKAKARAKLFKGATPVGIPPSLHERFYEALVPHDSSEIEPLITYYRSKRWGLTTPEREHAERRISRCSGKKYKEVQKWKKLAAPKPDDFDRDNARRLLDALNNIHFIFI